MCLHKSKGARSQLYIYLHGFASSPLSTKARYLGDRFTEVGINLNILDLNLGDFSHLTLTRQLHRVASSFPSPDTFVTIIGSSFGGLSAAHLAEQYPQVQRLILLAPAFGFMSHWLPQLGKAKIEQWRAEGYYKVYHYGEGREVPLHYQFLADLQQYQDSNLHRSIPTLILHGIKDDVIPIISSREYAKNRPWVELVELHSDHTLTDVMPQIWQHIQQFCQTQNDRQSNDYL